MSRIAFISAGLAGFLLATCATRATGQIGYLWTYDELLDEADVVVIGECLGTVDTGLRRSHRELVPALSVQELRTTFRVSAVLKQMEARTLEAELGVRHYRYTDEAGKPGLVNAGSWLRLEPGRSYLLFLRRAAGDVYEPLSGHTFPDDSVYELQKADGRRGR